LKIEGYFLEVLSKRSTDTTQGRAAAKPLRQTEGTLVRATFMGVIMQDCHKFA